MGVLLSSDSEQALQLVRGSPIFISSDALEQALRLRIQCGRPELSDRAFEGVLSLLCTRSTFCSEDTGSLPFPGAFDPIRAF